MSITLLTSYDFNKLELLNGRLQNLASDPGSPVAGQFYFNTATKKLRVYDGTASWVEMGTGGGTFSSITATQPAAGLTVTTSGVAQTSTASYTFALANDLAALEALATTGYAKRTGADAWSLVTALPWADVTTPTTLSGYSIVATDVTAQLLTNYVAGTNTVLAATDTMLAAFQKIQGQITARGVGTVTGITLTQPAAGLTVTNTGVNQTTAATGTIALANDLAALEGLASTGYAVRTAADTWAQRTLTGTTNQVTITNGGGLVGDPVFSLPQNVHTAATPAFASMTLSAMGATATDVATKGYVDGLMQGVKWKQSVKAATAVAGTLATSFANAQVIDGITLVTGDRILVKDQASQLENGIYTVNASGAPTRALDADTWLELTAATVMVEQGTANTDITYVSTINTGGTLNTTAVTFTKMANAVGTVDLATKVTGQLPTANGGTGTVTSGTQYGVVYYTTATGMASTAAGTSTGVLHGNAAGAPTFGPVVNADITNATIDLTTKVTGMLPILNGGTGGSTAALARTALAVPGKYSQAVGDNAATSILVTHNLGTQDVHVQLFSATTPWAQFICDVQATSINTVTLGFSVAPTAGQYRVVIMG
jgi:hypothetical protein